MSERVEIDVAERYSRQIRLRGVGVEGQERLQGGRVLVVGLGGLGSPVAMYLAGAGVGRLCLADFDCVDESNLQRQVVHRHCDVGELKAQSAARTVRALNPGVEVECLDYALEYEDLCGMLTEVDVLVDCTDNFPSRFAMNRAALETKTPWVSGAAIRWEGQVTSFDPRVEGSPCFRCLYPQEDLPETSCELEGVIAPLVGVIGTMQAMEVVNVLLGRGRLAGVVWLLDARGMEWERVVLRRGEGCVGCGGG